MEGRAAWSARIWVEQKRWVPGKPSPSLVLGNRDAKARAVFITNQRKTLDLPVT